MSLKDTVGCILRKLIQTSLGKVINWSGANDKPAFKRTLLKDVVLGECLHLMNCNVPLASKPSAVYSWRSNSV